MARARGVFFFLSRISLLFVLFGPHPGDGCRGSRSSEREPRRRRAAADSEGARRTRRGLHGVAGRDVPGVASRAPRDAHRHALRRRRRGPSGEVPRRGAHAAHVLPRAHGRRAISSALGRRVRLQQGRRRRRVVPALLAGREDGQGHDVHGRQIPQHGRRLLALRQMARVRVHAAEREGQRRLGRRPGRPEDRAEGPRSLGRRVGRLRLVARRQDAPGEGIRLREREPVLARGRGDGRQGARDAGVEGKGGVGQRRLREGREVPLCDDGPGRGIPPPRVSRPRLEKDHRADAEHRMGRVLAQPLRRRRQAGVRRERGRGRDAARPRHGDEKEIALPKIPPGSIGAVRFHANGKDLAFSLASARPPRTSTRST